MCILLRKMHQTSSEASLDAESSSLSGRARHPFAFRRPSGKSSRLPRRPCHPGEFQEPAAPVSPTASRLKIVRPAAQSLLIWSSWPSSCPVGQLSVKILISRILPSSPFRRASLSRRTGWSRSWTQARFHPRARRQASFSCQSRP